MNDAIEWLRKKKADKMILGVAVGNEKTFEFYAQFGFFPKVTILEMKNE